jgi:hypothetical protein
VTTTVTTQIANDGLAVKKGVRVTVEEVKTSLVTKKSLGRKAKYKAVKVVNDASPEQDELKEEDIATYKSTRKRKTKEKKEVEVILLTDRAVELKIYVSAYISIAKEVENTITNYVYISGNIFICFLKSQRK